MSLEKCLPFSSPDTSFIAWLSFCVGIKQTKC